MTVTVDANIMFSAAISPDSRIAKILTDPYYVIRKVSCHYAVIELFKHQPKIIKFAKKTLEDVLNDLYTIINSLELYNETLIESHHWREAVRLTEGVDNRDVSYVALTLQTGGWLWTGDKKLIAHLRVLGFEKVVNTEELFQMLNS